MSNVAGVTSPEIRERNRGYQAAARQRRRDAGLCMECSAPNPTVRERDRICLGCWFEGIAKGRSGSRRNGPMVRELYEQQGGRCAYTGELLIPGVSASLDHKLPVSRGGLNERDNLQWVTARINSMKADLTHEEFIALCGVIAASGLARQSAQAA